LSKSCPNCDGVVTRRDAVYCSIACYAKHRTKDVTDRFWAFVDVGGKDECWLWRGGTAKGYGAFHATIDGVRYSRANRVAWALANGDPGSMLVCHTCDNRMCVNPSHLFLGTDKDNIHDMWRKGRQSPPPVVTGERHHFSKMTTSTVREMRQRWAEGESIHSLARWFGVSSQSARAILIRKTWAHVP